MRSLNVYNIPTFVKILEDIIQEDGSSYICSYVASAIKMLEGDNIKIYGFSQKENPESKYFYDINEDPDEGHHFAVYNNRYIIDPWIYNNYKDYKTKKIFGRSVFDIKNPKDLPLIKYIYGNPKKWTDISNRSDKFESLFPEGATKLKKIKNKCNADFT